MKKYLPLTSFTIVVSLLLLNLNNEAYGQNCLLDMYEQGKSITVETSITPGILEFYPEYLTAKEKKKPKIEEAYLADVASGKIQPNTTTVTLLISKSEGDENGHIVEFSMEAYDKIYTSQVMCTNDSMYIARNKYPIIQEYEGTIMGIGIQGVKVIPLNIKVGDILPPYQDVGLTPKTSETFTMEEKVLTDIKTTTSIKYGAFQDSYDYQLKYGSHKVTETEYVYETIDVEVKKEAQGFLFTVNYAYAIVSGTEEVEYNGKKYTAYIIDSESWGKGMNQIEYESSSAQIVKNLKRMDRWVEKKGAKFLAKSGMTNEEGYIVTSSREWYVPGLGVVKTATYDMFGNFSSITTVKAINY